MSFNIDEIKDEFRKLNMEEDIIISKIPEIDLYMDQVIQLFENNLNNTKRYPEDKLLTKTMINNYAKDKLLIPVKNKRYNQNHIILMILIYSLKQGISIGDIKKLFGPLISELSSEGGDVELANIYENYLEIKKEQSKEEELFLNDLMDKIHTSKDNIDEGAEENYEEILLTVLLLINSSNLKKRLAEKLIDRFLV